MNDPDNQNERDDDYSLELHIDKFRRDNPTWTEEEIMNYFSNKSEP